jgi:hypothetical protein
MLLGTNYSVLNLRFKTAVLAKDVLITTEIGGIQKNILYFNLQD